MEKLKIIYFFPRGEHGELSKIIFFGRNCAAVVDIKKVKNFILI